VTIASIADNLQSAAERMDRESDILFLILTSHGSQAGVAVQAGRREEILSPVDLAAMLNRAGVRHRIVVISACYSGVFLRPLANDDTLVITAGRCPSLVVRLPGQGQMDLFRRRFLQHGAPPCR
jgi:hypothetical protein